MSLSNELYIGAPPDQEPDGSPSANATGDDNDGNDDEGGILSFQRRFVRPRAPGDSASMSRLRTRPGADALLCGWIDFNDDGDFDNADTAVGATSAERACTTVPDGSKATAPTRPLTLDFVKSPTISPPTSDMDNIHCALPVTSDWGNSSMDASPLGIANDGEVEDHVIDNSLAGQHQRLRDNRVA